VSRIQQPSARPGADAPSARSTPRRHASPPLATGRAPRTISGTAHPAASSSHFEPLPSFRFGNVLLAGLLLIVTAPLMLVIAVAVRLTSGGPVIYRQPRIGLDRRNGSGSSLGDRRGANLGGRPFRIYKFRTMYHRSGPHGRQVWTRPNDRRVTPVGRLLRLYRLDELPQVINVMKGEMNVVGPRPEQPEIFARLRERFERYPERQRVLPGITGLAQVRCGYGGSMADVERKLGFDLEYVEARSVRTDLRILLKTLPVVLSGRGAR
jgi:lipopolysaccharide/colanic/teichoic acid biosynthesis glycosyltransferase